MARGWESKSVEAQQEELASKPAQKRSILTPDQAARQRELEGLKLSRNRIVQQLAAIQDPRRRTMLEKALSDLEMKIRALGS
ncbi:MAG TPA: hypothetical protein VFO39_06615 [Candidatus Sulfotelmatobacter sp.]|nr:hypothetical protein [Candidatus Sulfotelmatobacter sp.]